MYKVMLFSYQGTGDTVEKKSLHFSCNSRNFAGKEVKVG